MPRDTNTGSEEQTESADLKDSQNSALLAASTIIVFSAIYWAIQIESVKELLILAYGQLNVLSGTAGILPGSHNSQSYFIGE